MTQGRHFLQIPGPSPVPDRVLRAMDMPVIDHRSSQFAELAKAVFEGCQKIFQTAGPVIIFPSSGTGAWEAAIVNTLSPGDKVLMVETGHFATLWRQMAARWGIEVDFMPLVDTISSLGSVDYRHDEWKVDVTVSCSQKGFMLPPGLGFNAISEKARAAAKTNRMPRSYWDWEEMLKPNAAGFFPYTPATNLLYGLREAIAMLLEEGLEAVFARHKRLAAATRAAVAHWGLEVLCLEPSEYSPVLTAVLMPPGHDADQFRKTVLDAYNMSLGSGLSKLAGKVFRIGHLGECNELTLMGALSGVEMGLAAAGVPHRAGGVDTAMKALEAPTLSNSPSHLKVVKT